ncbi:MAG: hypothetical protein AUJ20_07710 [Comamonadaceae bacterium CG1_02_60_18]|nr:MAG: hypothetical protein AUJ20_07710 [Comamonadaceae bacterium CG1_02_60_18]PIQ51710.1 MAG: hypothetical protein COW02_13475 [Comamonadaceae bacterium CG12_big_fil_rev_8_21_14_0_65_59_15]
MQGGWIMTNPLEPCLQAVRACVQKLEQELAQPASASSLEAAGASLYAQAFRLSALADQAQVATKKDAKLAQCLQHVAATLTSCQSQLARRAAINAQALQTLVPAARSDTYTGGLRNRAAQPYGSAGHQSGEFKVIRA